MAKKKRSNFKSKVRKNTEQQKKDKKSFGYLQLPEGVKTWKEPAGERVYFDMLPYEVTDKKHSDRDSDEGIGIPGELWYKRPFRIHRNIGGNNDTVVCPSTIKKSCPICEHRAQRLKEGASWQDDEIKALKQSHRNLYVVIPIGQKEYDEKPHIWDISQYLFQEKLNEELEEDEDNANFPDLEEGLTLRIRFSEEKIGKNTFADTSRIDFEERDDVYDESILEDVPNLDEALKIMSYKEISALFMEMDEDEIEDAEEPEEESEKEQEDEKPKRRKKKTAPKDEDEEKPKRKKKPVKEESEKVDTDDDSGTAKPSKRTKKKTNKEETNEQECPHGYHFGVDTDTSDECDECEVWEACDVKKEELEKG